jgi:molybdenum cofactor biosynthesis enzyme MoaA
MHIATNSTGNLRVCCNAIPWESYIWKEKDKPYKIFKDDIKEAWHSDSYKNIRQTMLDGKRPDICERCFREEDAGIKSARQSANEQWGTECDMTTTPDMNIRYVDLRLGNLCNLKCRMCNPISSSMWVKDWNEAVKEEAQLPPEEIERLTKMDWPTKDKTWDNIKEIMPYIEMIYFTGGEPTLTLEQMTLLEYCIDSEYTDITLKYNTNLTNIPERMLDLWKNFKKIKVNASIDAVGDLNRYIRYPSSWEEITNNLDMLNNIPNVQIQIHTTVQMYNIFDLHNILVYFKDYNHFLNILNHPKYLNIRVLNKEHKQKIVNRLLTCPVHNDKSDGIIKYMQEDWSNKWPEFITYTKNVDKQRKENILDHIEEFNEDSNDWQS